jgi:hypothetical protein
LHGAPDCRAARVQAAAPAARFLKATAPFSALYRILSNAGYCVPIS